MNPIEEIIGIVAKAQRRKGLSPDASERDHITYLEDALAAIGQVAIRARRNPIQSVTAAPGATVTGVTQSINIS